MARKRIDIKDAELKKKSAHKRVKVKHAREEFERLASPESDQVEVLGTQTFPEPSILPPVSPVQLATRALMRKAEEARHDISKFYEFVIRHETSKAPLKVAAHQRVTFAFAMDHPQCVIRQPIGTGKTFTATALGLFLTGQDVTNRGAIVSKIQSQSGKVLHMVADYVTDPELSAPLALVFPWLKKSTRSGDLWNQSSITVERPAGIRDPSVVAVGLDGAIGGARLSWLLADDVLDADNTATPAAREQCNSRFDSRILSRLDPKGGRAVVTNSPWNREDLTYQLEGAGWPTLTMDIYGNFKFTNVDPEWLEKLGLVRPSTRKRGWWRLTEHDPDPEESTPLWPARYDTATIAEIRRLRLPHEFARLFLCQPFDETSSRCRREWIEAAKDRGRGLLKSGALAVNPSEGGAVYIGVDIAIGRGRHNDESSFVSYEQKQSGEKLLLEVDAGRWSGPELIAKLIEKHDRFGGVVIVESNSAQGFLSQFALEERRDLRIKNHITGSNKHDRDFGVESVFTELHQGAWIIPCDSKGNVAPQVERLIDECLFYQPPPAHTGDRLMALWFACEGARTGKRRTSKDAPPRVGLRLSLATGGSF